MVTSQRREWLERQHKTRQSDFLEAIDTLDVHDHLALIYESNQEQFDAVVPFIANGLEANHRCLYVVDDNTAEVVFDEMDTQGIDVETAQAEGQLVVTGKERTYLQDGYFDPDEMIQFLAEETDRAKSDGFDALRVTGEMTWTLGGDPGTERLMEYEAKLNEFLPAHDALAICQYNRDRFSSTVIRDVIRTHPHLIYNYAVLDNYYYQEPDVFRSDDTNDIVENQLRAIADQNRRRARLQEQQQRLTVLNRILRHDLRNDMTVLFGLADRLQDRLTADDGALADEIIDVGAQILERNDRIHRINSRLTEESSIEPRDIVGILAPQSDRLRDHYPDASVELHASRSDEILAYAIPQLGIAFRELLENAVQHHDGTDPRVDIRVDRTDKAMAVVQIIDRNPPIPATITDLVTAKADFDPVNHSTGLGLWIANWIVRRAGGELSFRTREPRGNVVTVELERASPPASS